MAFAGMNYLAIIAATVASYIFGALWYNALAKPWMAALGVKPEDLKGPGGKVSPVPFVIAFLAQLVMAWMLAGVIGHLGPGQITLRNGVISAAFLWFGFVMTTLAVNYAFARRRPMLAAIDGGHWLGVMLVQGAVVGAFGAP